MNVNNTIIKIHAESKQTIVFLRWIKCYGNLLTLMYNISDGMFKH